MAKVSGKCPVCGAITRVNDEKISGYCAKCGSEINVAESIQLLQKKVEAAEMPPRQAGSSQRQQRREERAKEAENKAKAVRSAQKIHDMFQLCANEQDYLMLRPKIMEMKITDDEKAGLLEALDSATKERLKEVLKKANDYKESQESPLSAVIGCVVIVGIGLAVNYFFSMTWPGVIAIGFAVIGLIGALIDKFDKKKLQENAAAANLIEQYRKLGYKI